ncbi:3-deoxy-manno-octulosonate cytidylyltransferase [Pseudohaliea rubra]|uniref:3-deoxy-manno-octulosonate cytidylyltransferase n=1 Tax=Pseudohaliea rubra DSM 19751 TaxID=1265313 RepID=A0A095WXK0_9GAMM|nr:3-deoxy-manno-octulosonate cytidylyltransferase [Pseudohaliea rubra]KGE03354.1 3-deoxy-manno-octulosonate cytidylyltransferase [Pseudohaliea rubra DSM 19751]
MAFIVVIPARYASTRLPGKPLAMIGDRPMLQHVWDQAAASGADRVVIATDDERVRDAAALWGAEALLTRDDHPSGTDRLAEVAAALELDDDAIVVNVQGDEPLLPPAVIDQVAENLRQRLWASVATLCEPLAAGEQLDNPNVVKVVADGAGRALYFSRAPIPYPREAAAVAGSPWRRHIGLYAYRVGFLDRFVTWAVAPAEALEQLEQLRALHHGEAIHVAEACLSVPGGVDTPEDLDRLRRHWETQIGVRRG